MNFLEIHTQISKQACKGSFIHNLNFKILLFHRSISRQEVLKSGLLFDLFDISITFVRNRGNFCKRSST